MPFYANESPDKKFNSFGPDLTRGINSTLNSLASGRIIDHTPYRAPESNNKSVGGYDVHYSTPVSGDLATDSTASPSEHLYDLPLIRSSVDSPSPTEGLHLLPSATVLMGTPLADRRNVGSLVRPVASHELEADKPERNLSPLSFVSDALSGKTILRLSNCDSFEELAEIANLPVPTLPLVWNRFLAAE